jgi:hypothetical protein
MKMTVDEIKSAIGPERMYPGAEGCRRLAFNTDSLSCRTAEDVSMVIDHFREQCLAKRDELAVLKLAVRDWDGSGSLSVLWRLDDEHVLHLLAEKHRGDTRLTYAIDEVFRFRPGDTVEFRPTRAMLAHGYPGPAAAMWEHESHLGKQTTIDEVRGGSLLVTPLVGAYAWQAFRLVRRADPLVTRIEARLAENPHGFELIEELAARG